MDDVLQLRQDHSALSWDSLEYIGAFINNDILMRGMVLLDTPGINTMIERHEMLPDSSLNLASRIIYAAGHAVTQVDAEKLRMLCSLGFSPCFVRTHFNAIRSSEEAPEDAIAADIDVLNSCGISEIDCYFVSNHADSEWISKDPASHCNR